jgi:hypothetical protein
MATESTSGKMDGCLKGNIITISWRGKAYSPGKMEGNMKGNTLMTRNLDMERLNGQMAGNTKGTGIMANNTEKGCILTGMEMKEEASGSKEKE